MQNVLRKLVIYQIMTRLFGNRKNANKPYGTIEENGVGKFNDITPAALQGIRELGVTHVWYTGVIEHALLTDYGAFGIPPDNPAVVKGRAGSPYAIKDYYDVNPDLAVNIVERMNEFEGLVRRTHQQGMKVIIDFVPNHVARVYRSDAKPSGVEDLGASDKSDVAFHPNNNFYYLPGEAFTPPPEYHPLGGKAHQLKVGDFYESPAKATGNDEFSASPGLHSWFETVKLNYGVDIKDQGKTYFDPIPDTWQKMRDILLFWTGKNVDGFRCDMAEMVPVDFWEWVIPQIKEKNSSIIFIAEIYNHAQYQTYIEKGRFDYLYDKVLLYDMLREVIGGQKNTVEIAATQNALQGLDRHMLRFMENHDEQRVASPYVAGNPWRGFPAMVISATIDRGPVMIYFGQEVGEEAAGTAGFQRDDGRTTIFDYWGVPEHQKWMNDGKFDGGRLSEDQRALRRGYARLLTLASSRQAITQGKYTDITTANVEAGNFSPRIYAFLRYHLNERMLIITSFSDTEEQARIAIPHSALQSMVLEPNAAYIANDLLWHETSLAMQQDLSLTLTLKPYACFIFEIGCVVDDQENIR